MGLKSPHVILMMLPLVCAIIPAAVAALPPAIAQEDTPLGEEEDIAGSIVSNVLGGSDNADNDGEENYGAEGEFNQDATITATIDPNQEQGVEDNLGEFGDDAADLDDTKAAVPIATPSNVEEESSSATSPPADTLQSLSIRFADQPSLTLNQPFDNRGLATSASITASGTTSVTGSGGTMTLTSDTNVFSICEDDETGELSNTQNIQSTVSSDPVTIEPGTQQPFEITTDPITEPIGDGGCEEGQKAILNFVQFIEPVLTIQTEGGNTVTHAFPSVP
jgi:hypothetical protein